MKIDLSRQAPPSPARFRAGVVAASAASLLATVGVLIAVLTRIAGEWVIPLAIATIIMVAFVVSFKFMVAFRRARLRAGPRLLHASWRSDAEGHQRLADSADQLVGIKDPDRLPSLAALVASAREEVHVAGAQFVRYLRREKVDIRHFVRRGGRMRILIEDPKVVENLAKSQVPTKELSAEMHRATWRFLAELSHELRGEGIWIRQASAPLPWHLLVVDNTLLATTNSILTPPGLIPYYLTATVESSPVAVRAFREGFEAAWRAAQVFDMDERRL